MKEGDVVRVPRKPGSITVLCQRGTVVTVAPPYCKVLVRYGRRQKGFWCGKISDVEKGNA